MIKYPKRLIEVDLPIKRISAHARREKSIRHGHISTLHIWWARRPLAACRAIICASLWPDPVDTICPSLFRDKARAAMLAWSSHERQMLLSDVSRVRFEKVRQNPNLLDDSKELRFALLDFIADFSNWDNSTVKEYLETSRMLTQVAHESLGGVTGTRPMVADPFSGGGAIPIEALRVGADVFASDLNPVAVMLNKVILDYIPRYGQCLADDVRKFGSWVKDQATKELMNFYPKDLDGKTPIAYLWARTIRCEGPNCGVEVPLMPSVLLSKRKNNSAGFKLSSNKDRNGIDITLQQPIESGFNDKGTLARGSVTCPVCGYTTPIKSVRIQLTEVGGGADSARLLAVVVEDSKSSKRSYRIPSQKDLDAVIQAKKEILRRSKVAGDGFVTVPNEQLPLMSGVFNVPLYGHSTWGSMFTSRQALLLTTLSRIVRDMCSQIDAKEFQCPAEVVQTLLALAVDRQADYASSICTWVSSGEFIGHTFAQGQSLPIKFDFAESAPLAGGSGSWAGAIDWIARVCESCMAVSSHVGTVARLSATQHSLPDDSVALLATDPPYYNAVPYADLSDFFYVWLRRTLQKVHPELLSSSLSPKKEEITEMSGWDSLRYAHKDKSFYEREMGKAMAEGRRILQPSGIGIIVFAHKSTAGWEAQLEAMVNAGWTITASWAIDTEMGARLRARNSAALASSVHLVCRPRENQDGSVRNNDIGDWRDVLQELPRRIHEWMPRLANEGVVGADAIFACLGPALEIFSRYSHVEKASGEIVPLKEYLEQVWAAVAKEALKLVFKDADTVGFEADARLTAMWLWTLNAGNVSDNSESVEEEDEDADNGKSSKIKGGFVLEYDAARKIAQGLGADLEKMDHLVEIKGDVARLIPVEERARFLFGKEEEDGTAVFGTPSKRKKKNEDQKDFFTELMGEESAPVVQKKVEALGKQLTGKASATVLDKVHQSMILFAVGRGEALKRFLVEDGIGQDQRFWHLAQALSALYPASSEEKRWVDGVLARKKGLGF